MSPKRVAGERNDRACYSVLRFCELMDEANLTTVEILFLPPDCRAGRLTQIIEKQRPGGLHCFPYLPALMHFKLARVAGFEPATN